MAEAMTYGNWGLLAPVLVFVAMTLHGCGGGGVGPVIQENSDRKGNLCGPLFDCTTQTVGGSMSIAFQARWEAKVNPSAGLIHFGSAWPNDNILIHDNYTDDSLTVVVTHPEAPGGIFKVWCPYMVHADKDWHYYLWSSYSPSTYNVDEELGRADSVQKLWVDGEEKCSFQHSFTPRPVLRTSLLVGDVLAGAGSMPFSAGEIQSVKVFGQAVTFEQAWPEYNGFTSGASGKVLIAILVIFIVVAIIAIVALFAYQKGWIGKKKKKAPRRLEEDSYEEDEYGGYGEE